MSLLRFQHQSTPLMASPVGVGSVQGEAVTILVVLVVLEQVIVPPTTSSSSSSSSLIYTPNELAHVSQSHLTTVATATVTTNTGTLLMLSKHSQHLINNPFCSFSVSFFASFLFKHTFLSQHFCFFSYSYFYPYHILGRSGHNICRQGHLASEGYEK